MRVVLPWPCRELSPNARVHWTKKARAAKNYRAIALVMAHVKARQLNRPSGLESARVGIEFYPPDNRRRDLDNMLASMKPAIDGIAAAIGVDDSKWEISMKKGAAVEGGLVVVEVVS